MWCQHLNGSAKVRPSQFVWNLVVTIFLLSQFGRKKKKFRGKSSSTSSSKEPEKKEVKKDDEEEEDEDDEEDGDVSKYKLDVSGGVYYNNLIKFGQITVQHHCTNSFSRTMTTRTKMETCRSMTWMPATTTLAKQPRKRAATPVPPAPPRALPAPVLGPGPGKRAEVKGNSGQNVSISSIFF